MKRFLSIFLICVAIISLAGCGSSFDYVNDDTLIERYTLTVEGDSVVAEGESGIKMTMPLEVKQYVEEVEPEEVVWDGLRKLEHKKSWDKDEITIDEDMTSVVMNKETTDVMLQEIYEITFAYSNCRGTDRPLTVEHRYIGEIPTIFMYEEYTSKMPTVILHHGSGSRKDTETIMLAALRMTKNGGLAISMDAKYHGERQDLYNEDVLAYSVDDISDIIDYAVETNLADEERIGVSGFSLGGFVSLIMPLKDERVKTVAAIAASPIIGANPERKLSEKEEILYDKYVPIEHAKELSRVPLLLLNGEEDNVISPKGVEELTRIVEEEKLYEGREDEYKQIEYPGLDHNTNGEMYEELEKWFLKFLIER